MAFQVWRQRVDNANGLGFREPKSRVFVPPENSRHLMLAELVNRHGHPELRGVAQAQNTLLSRETIPSSNLHTK